jgi:XRE family transcriptional regulator, regulator of sulfur utilization
MPDLPENHWRQLDRALAELDAHVRLGRPDGWITTMRRACRLSQFALGERIGVTQPRVAQLEHAEVTGTIRLSSLRRTAAGLHCSLAYVMVPLEFVGPTSFGSDVTAERP